MYELFKLYVYYIYCACYLCDICLLNVMLTCFYICIVSNYLFVGKIAIMVIPDYVENLKKLFMSYMSYNDEYINIFFLNTTSSHYTFDG